MRRTKFPVCLVEVDTQTGIFYRLTQQYGQCIKALFADSGDQDPSLAALQARMCAWGAVFFPLHAKSFVCAMR